jgi:tetratricopeptide (TPR) repeat protein
MKRVLSLLFVFLFALCINCIAQKQGRAKIDSLRIVLIKLDRIENSYSNDTAIIKTLNSLGYEYYSIKPDSTLLSAERAADLSRRINYKIGEGAAYNVAGIGYWVNGELDKAMEYHLKSLKIREDIGDKNGIAQSLSNIGMLCNGEQALEYYNKSLRITDEIGDERGSGATAQKIGIIYWNKGEYDKALSYYEKSLKVAKKFDDRKVIAAGLTNIGMVFGKKGEIAKELKYFFEGLKIRKEEGDKSGMANSYFNIGSVYGTQGKYEESIKYQLESIKIREELNDKAGLAYSYNSLGIFYADRGDKKNALEYYDKALRIKEESGNKLNIADQFNNIANVYARSRDFDQALNFYSKALKIYSDIGNRGKRAMIFCNMGSALTEKGDYLKATANLENGISIFRKEGDTLDAGLAINYNNLADLYFKIKKVDQAKALHQKALVIAKKFDSKQDILEAYLGLSKCDSATKNYKDAFGWYYMFTLLKDSLFNIENSGHVTEIQTKYETEKKEKEIVLLQRDKSLQESRLQKQKLISYFITGGAGVIILSSVFIFLFYKRKRDAEQKQKEISLSLQVSETEMKALRSQMNPHFIFNALQSIQTFLMSHRSEEANTYLLKFSKLMRLVLENSQHSEVSLKDDMQALELYMQLESIRLPHPFTYEFHIDESIDVENDTIPPLILQPFVENAIWHGLQYKSETGHINIFISKKDNALYATIEDNGVGRDMSKQVQQPMLIKKESLGMKLTEERLKILNEEENKSGV